MLDALSVQQERGRAALACPESRERQGIFAGYLDAAAFSPQEKGSDLYKSVVISATLYIAANLHDTLALGNLAEQSWVYGDLVEAELVREELELTLEHEGIQGDALEVLNRIASLEYLEEG